LPAKLASDFKICQWIYRLPANPGIVSRYRVDVRFIGRFALRRAIRLDPPYWMSIVLFIALVKPDKIFRFPDARGTSGEPRGQTEFQVDLKLGLTPPSLLARCIVAQ